MSFETYWRRVLKQNPKLSNSRKLTLTIESFRQCLNRAYVEGVKDGHSQADFEKSLLQRIFG